MNARSASRLLLCLLLTMPLPTAASTPAIDLADAAAGKWLAQVDGGDYRESWASAATLFRQRISAADWIETVRAARQPLGAMTARQLIDARHVRSLPGAPDGDYVVLRYRTIFRHKQSAVETVTPMLDQGQWRVSGYFIH